MTDRFGEPLKNGHIIHYDLCFYLVENNIAKYIAGARTDCDIQGSRDFLKKFDLKVHELHSTQLDLVTNPITISKLKSKFETSHSNS
jgi:hypothetical protein